MIVNYTANGWEIITQRAHGLLAAQLASHWKKTVRSGRWLETLLAIADHDDAQIEMERDNLLTPQGGPVNFKMKHFEIEHGRRTLNFALSKSRYIALLCSMHLEFVYGKERDTNAEAVQFLNDQAIMRKQWRKELNLSEQAAQKDYDLLEWCDAFSLLLCQHENQPESRAIEISLGPDHKHYHCIQLYPGKLTVTPWPFEERTFDVYFESRILPQLYFKDETAFKDQFNKATVTSNTWILEKS
jgi:hypothetical protein